MIKPKNLLIVRTDRIGDVVLSLPLAGLIKKHYPGCRVSFLLRNYTKDLAVNNPHIDEILILKEADGKILIKENIKQIRERNFDSSVIVYPTLETALITFLSGIKKRVGTGYRWYSALFNEKVFEHRKYAEKHELEFNVQLLRKFGINENPTPSNVFFNLEPDPAAQKKIDDLLTSSGVNKNLPVIIFHPGSGGSAIDLPADKFAELISLTAEKLNIEIWLTGNKEEKKLCSKIAGSNNVKIFAGEFSLGELIALINRCDIFAANSTGPIHIAAALNKNIIGFYPKILACSPQRWGPYTQKKYIFMPKINCTNCSREQCERLNCMSSINVEEVFESISEIYNKISINGEKNV